ncbi:MAG: ABC transporter ATP-binding protein [Bacteroidota bacterium]
MIEFQHTDKQYGKITAFSTDQLKIEQGETLGVVGNNGAGKTTMLRLILDLVKPTKGLVTSKGQDVFRSDHWKSYTGSFLDDGFLIPFLKPMEYLEFIGSLYRIPKSEIDGFLSQNHQFFDEQLFKGKKLIRDLSTGNRTKVGILSALIHNPEIVILDEPFANLDPGSQSWLKGKIKSIATSFRTMIVSSHDLRHITDIATRIIVLEDGQVVQDCPNDEKMLTQLEAYFERPSEFG